MKKTLRGIGLIAALSIASGASAQESDFNIYPTGTSFTDIDGETHDIDAILATGTPVIIDAFADWCPPCWSYHVGGTLEEVYESIGDGGTGEAKIFGIEADPSEPESYISDASTGMGDWTLGGTIGYPLADDDLLAPNINLSYYPTLVLVCPDHSMSEVGQVSAAAWEAAVAACPGVSTADHDPRIVSNESTSDVQVCGSGDYEAEVKVGVQNHSLEPLSGTYTFEASLGGAVIATEDVVLSLDSYEATEVNLGFVELELGANDVEVKITTANDDLTNDDIIVAINVTQATDMGSGDIWFDIVFDGTGSQIAVALASGLPDELDVFAIYGPMSGGTYPGLIQFDDFGTWTDATSEDRLTYPSLDEGCYHLFPIANTGGGLDNGGGSLTVVSPDSGIEASLPLDFGYGVPFLFQVTADGDGEFTGIEEVEAIEFASVYPNPANDFTNIKFELNTTSNVTIELVNALGQVVYTNNLGMVSGQQTVAINSSDLSEGIYLVNINVDNNILTKKLSVVK